MSVSEAYRRLQITDRNISDDGVIASFVSCVLQVNKSLIVDYGLSPRPESLERSLASCRKGQKQSCDTKLLE